MSDKNLTELEWKKFAKGRNLKDAALVKALADLERAAKTGPGAQLAALVDIEKQADSLRKSAKGDKELAGYLDDLDKALDKQRKLSEFEAKKAAKAQSKDEEEEEATPALLTTKMIPLIREVKKGGEFPVLLASTGKEVAVMLSRRAISPARRKLMTTYLDAGAPKFFPGICIFEANAYTFVLQTQAGGLAKKVKAALLKQVELRLRVRVRGEDPKDVDEELGEADDDEPAPGATHAAPAGDTAAAPANADDLKTQYETRSARLIPLTLAALKARQGDVSKIRAVADFAREKGAGGNYKAALSALDALEKLLATASPTLTATGDAAAAFTARLAGLLPRVKQASAAARDEVKRKLNAAGALAQNKAFDQANAELDEAEKLLSAPVPQAAAEESEDEDLPLDTSTLGALDAARFSQGWAAVKSGWLDASETVDAQITRLQAKLRTDADHELQQIAELGLNGVTGNHKVPLMAALRSIDGAGSDTQKLAALLERAAEAARAFKNHLQSAETVAACDDNPFGVSVSIRATLVPALDQVTRFVSDVQAR